MRVFLRLIVFIALSQQMFADEVWPPTSFNIKPTPGKDAFWAHNPKNSSQKILLVPSRHDLSLRFVQPELVKMMKEGNVLINESSIKGESWDDATRLKDSFTFKIEDLKKAGLIRNTPFTYKDMDQDDKIMPYIDSLAHFVKTEGDPHLNLTVEKLEKMFRSIVGVPLQNVHPKIVIMALRVMAWYKSAIFFGMDAQIIKFFQLSNRPILALETASEISELRNNASHADLIDAIKKMEVSGADIFNIYDAFKDLTEIKEQTPNQIYEKIAQDFKGFLGITSYGAPITKKEEERMGSIAASAARNRLWVPRLLRYFDQNAGKSIVVVVGASHFPGTINGLFKLLFDQGFSFTRLTWPN